MLVVRPAREDDFNDLEELARLAGPGFTSLSVDQAGLRKKLERSVANFAAEVKEPGDELYWLLLEDAESGAVVGMGGVKARVGVHAPFFSFRRTTIAQWSSEVDRRFDMDVLFAVNEAAGATEVGSLFVRAEARRNGAGRLIAQSRYMLMAAALERFGSHVIAELRGVVDADGRSAFWEALGRHFFRMDFNEADRLSALDSQFLSDLLPTHPIYIDLLPEDARAVIGEPHPDGRPARKLLEAQGFRYDGLVDVFDGGPLMVARKELLAGVKDSAIAALADGDPEDGAAVDALISNDRFSDFRACWSQVSLRDGEVRAPQATAQALNVNAGDRVRVWTRRT
jgi:arginine N-succinyltransferase